MDPFLQFSKAFVVIRILLSFNLRSCGLFTFFFNFLVEYLLNSLKCTVFLVACFVGHLFILQPIKAPNC